MKLYIKGFLPVASIFFSLIINGTVEEIHYHKTRPINVPPIVDGTRGLGIDGYEIRKLIYIIREVEKLHHGILDPISKERRGMYLFKGSYHTISSLTIIEIECLLTPEEKIELHNLLIQIRKHFIKIATPFIEQARGVKLITLKFMHEWAEKHDRVHSPLLEWSRQRDGTEVDAFHRDINNFKKFNEFCIDLISFISDLIQSCPRAWEQFLELQKKKN